VISGKFVAYNDTSEFSSAAPPASHKGYGPLIFQHPEFWHLSVPTVHKHSQSH